MSEREQAWPKRYTIGELEKYMERGDIIILAPNADVAEHYSRERLLDYARACAGMDDPAKEIAELRAKAELVLELAEALRSVAPNWDKLMGYCWCSPDAFRDDDGESIKHDGNHEPDCAKARAALAKAGVKP